MTPLVRFEGVGKMFGRAGVLALADINLEIPPGARIALVGPSGSGKSTILSLAAGLDHPSSGRVSWPGLQPPLLPREIGFAFQGPSLIPWLDVEENVSLPLHVAGDAETEQASALLAMLGVDSLLHKLPEEISGGQAQRVGLARAMATTPRLLLADEPTGQLDRETANAVMDALFKWSDGSGAALVVATHDAEVARQFTEVWSLAHGRLLDSAS